MRNAKHANAPVGHQPAFPSATPGRPDPIYVLCGPVLCRLRVWSETEWAGLPEHERPQKSVHVPGLGWVGALPVAVMN